MANLFNIQIKVLFTVMHKCAFQGKTFKSVTNIKFQQPMFNKTVGRQLRQFRAQRYDTFGSRMRIRNGKNYRHTLLNASLLEHYITLKELDQE